MPESIQAAASLLSELDLERDSAWLQTVTPPARRGMLTVARHRLEDAASHPAGFREAGSDALAAIGKLLDALEFRRAEHLLFTSRVSRDGIVLCDRLEGWGYYLPLARVCERIICHMAGPRAGHLRLVLGRARRYAGHLAEAKRHLSAVATALPAEAEDVDRAWAHHELALMDGDVGTREGDEQALAGFARALRLFRRRGVAAGMLAAWASGARIAFEHGRIRAAQRHFDRALGIPAEHVVTVRERAWALLDYARLLANDGDQSRAQRYAFEALVTFRRTLRHEAGTAWACYGLGLVFANLGRQFMATRALNTAERRFRILGNRGGVAWTRHIMARVALQKGRYKEAHELYRSVINVHYEEPDRRLLIFALEGFARLAAYDASPATAALLLGGTSWIRKAEDVPLPVMDRAELKAAEACARAQLSGAQFEAEWLKGYGIGTDTLVDIAVPVMPRPASF